MSNKVKPPKWFWILTAFFLLWNLLGFAAFLAEAFSPDMVIVGYSDEQLKMYNSRPNWYMFNFAVATITGITACILLLFRVKMADALASISLIAVVMSAFYNTYSGAINLINLTDKFLFYVVLILSLILCVFTIYAARKRWIT